MGLGLKFNSLLMSLRRKIMSKGDDQVSGALECPELRLFQCLGVDSGAGETGPGTVPSMTLCKTSCHLEVLCLQLED